MELGLRLYSRKTGKNLVRLAFVDQDEDVCSYFNLNSECKYLSGPHSCSRDEFHKLIDAKNLPKEPIKILDEEKLRETDKKKRDERLTLINPIVIKKPQCYDSTWVRNEIAKIKKDNPSISTYKLKSAIIKYQASGEIKNSLLSVYCNSGGAGKNRKAKSGFLGRTPKTFTGHEKILTQKDLDTIAKHYKKYSKNNSLTLKAKYRLLLTEHYKNQDKYPSYWQYRNHGRNLNDPEACFKAKVGEVNFNKDHRTLTGDARETAFGPGSEAQIDSTTDDTHALSLVIPNTYIGRLTLYLMPDTYSAMPMGIALIPDNPSYASACYTLVNAVTDKVIFTKMLDVPMEEPTDWPCKYFPAKIFGDRGLLLGKKADSLTKSLRIEVDNAPSKRPELKPIVERHIGKLLQNIAGILEKKGLVNKKDSPRITTDARLEATLTYRDILRIIVTELLYHIKYEPIAGYPMTDDMKRLDLLPTSLNLWNYGCSLGNASLIEIDPVEARIKLLEQKDCRYDKTGIELFGDRWCCIDKEGLQAFNKVRFGKGPKKLTVSFDSSDKSEVYWNFNEKYFRLKPTRGNSTFRSFWEVEFFNQRQAALKKTTEHERNLAFARKTEFQRGVIKEATKRKKLNGGKVKRGDVRATRKKDFERFKNEPFVKPQSKTPMQFKERKEVLDNFSLPEF